MKLNQKIVDSLGLPEGKSAIIFWDDECPGLGVRLQGNTRRWVVRYRVAGNPKQKQITLGPLVGMSLRKAREGAVEYTSAAKRGVDLASAEKAAAEEAQRLEKSRAEGRLSAILDRYLQHAETHLRPSTFKDLTRYLTVAWQPMHGDVVTELDTRDIIARLEVIARENGPVAANRARSALSQCMSWAVASGLIPRNPLADTRAITVEKPRDRVLAHDEIATLWLETSRPGDFSTIIRLLLLTAQRREEVAAMRWSEIDLDRGIWELPGSRTKNGRPHLIPLSSQVGSILESLERRGQRELVFGTGRGGFSGWGQCKARLDRRSGLSGWRIHDLRRTAVTQMAEIGVQPHVIEAVVNHVSGHKGGIKQLLRLLRLRMVRGFYFEADGRTQTAPIPWDIWFSTHAEPILNTGITWTPGAFLHVPIYFPLIFKERDIAMAVTHALAQKSEPAWVTGPATHEVNRNRGPGGRPTTWNWHAARLEMSRIIHVEGVSSQSTIIKRIADWFASADREGNHPANRTIRPHAQEALAVLQEG